METAAARSAGERLDPTLAIEGLLHSEGWLGFARPAPKEAKHSRGSAERSRTNAECLPSLNTELPRSCAGTT